MIDWKKGQEHSLSPFFGAGTAKAVDWIHRDEGEKTNAAGLKYIWREDSYIVCEYFWNRWLHKISRISISSKDTSIITGTD
jgi:hypothetical protein